ncbi:MAG: hypothetical protein QOH95_852 [Gaiellaceae bacterium]|jgi:hypothetical protein|nr:hypothetical protein [Gaiellaceae bacterium]
MPEPRLYRRNTHRLVFTAVYVAGAIAASLPAVLAEAPGLVIVIVILGALLLVLLAWRTFRIAVLISGDEVVVRNVCRDRRVPLEQVSSFDWGDWWRFPIGGVWLLDGSFVRAFALNPPFELERGQDKAVPQALARLNAELDRARQAAEEDPPALVEPTPRMS